MKKSRTRYSWVLWTLLITVSLASCYKFSSIFTPKEVAPNTAYEGRIVAINDGNNGEQTGYSVFAIRVPRNWEVTVGDSAYVQYGPEGLKNSEGDDVNMAAPMVYSVTLSELYNESNPKEGYEWIAFRTEHVNRRSLVQGSGCDSIVFNYTVLNDGVAGTYELDYIMGSIEENNDDIHAIEQYAGDVNNFLGSDLCRVSTEHGTNPYGTNDFNSVVEEFRATITVLEGGTPVVYDPAISLSSTVAEPDAPITISYANLPQGAAVKLYKQASMLAMAQMGAVEGSDRHNNGSFTIEGLEPGIYQVKALRSSGLAVDGCADVQLVVKGYNDKALASENKLMVIGETGMLAPSQLKAAGTAYEAARGLNASLFAESDEILSALIDSALAYKPNALLIAGGLTMNGAKESHEYLAGKLKALTEAGIKVCVIPGDQDINNPTACSFEGETATSVAAVSADEFASIYADFGYSTAASRDENSLSYISYITDDLAVLALDACEYEYTDSATAVNETAHLTPATVEWMKTAVKAAQERGHQVVALAHHMVGAPFNGYATLGVIMNNNDAIDLAASFFGGGSEDGEPVYELGTGDIQDALAECGISTIFTGDCSALDAAHIETPSGKPLYQVNTSSAVAYDCPFRLVGIGEKGLEVETHLTTNLAARGGMSFEDYAYSRTKYGWEEYIDTLCAQNWDLIDAFLQKNFVFTYDSAVDSFDKNLFFVLPKTPEEMATIINNSIIPPLVETIVTFVDGNEHLKTSQQLVDDFLAGIDNLLSGLNTLPSIINPMLKEGFADAGLDLDSTATIVVSSIAYNYVGNEENVTNDLFLYVPYTVEVADGIGALITDEQGICYDLLGRRVALPGKGVYVRDGKKVLVK